MTAHEIHTLSGAYAVDALDPEERERFEEHLTACESCQAEVAGLREAASLITELSSTTPSPELRDRVLADIAAVRPLPPEGAGRRDEVAARRRRPRWSGLLAAAAAAALFVGGGAVLWDQTHDTASTAEISAADQVLRARDVQHVSVDLPGGASATVFRSLAQNRAVLVTDDMPAAPRGKTYQLWLQKDGRMVPAGLMHGGGTEQTVLLRGTVAGASGAGITVEPEGGSDAPTSAPVALFDFGQAT